MHETMTVTDSAPSPPRRRGRPTVRRVVRVLAVLTAIALVGGGVWYLLLFLLTRTETATAPIKESVERVEVAVSSGNLQVDVVESGQDPELHKELTKSLRSPDEDIKQEGGTLHITADCGDGVGQCSSDYRLTVPAGTEIKLVTRLGDVSVKGVRASVEARTQIGGVSLDHVSGDHVVASSKTGAVTLTHTEFTTAEAVSNIGEVRVEGVDDFEKLEAVSRIGDVEVRLPSGAGPFDVDASSELGGRTVTVEQDSSSGSTVQARTKIGDVTVRED